MFLSNIILEIVDPLRYMVLYVWKRSRALSSHMRYPKVMIAHTVPQHFTYHGTGDEPQNFGILQMDHLADPKAKVGQEPREEKLGI